MHENGSVAASNVVSTAVCLCRLASACDDAEVCRRWAARTVAEPALAELFRQASEQCGAVLRELELHIEELELRAGASSFAAGYRPRPRLGPLPRAALATDAVLVAECARRDAVALDLYDAALRANLPHRLHVALERHRGHFAAIRRHLIALFGDAIGDPLDVR